MSDLNELRLEINEITEEMMILFEKRLEVSKRIAAYKKEHNLPIFQPEREKELVDRYTKDALYPELSQAFLETLMNLSKTLQKEESEK